MTCRVQSALFARLRPISIGLVGLVCGMLTMAAVSSAQGRMHRSGSLAALRPASGSEGVRGLPMSEVVRVMAARRGQIRKQCYEESPVKADAAMRVEFTVGEGGTVTEAEAQNATGPQSITDCVIAAVKNTTFPHSDGVAHFHWPFIFKGP
ncbi:MAG: hypothetical protein NVS3B20_17590 [Polyangiales bacterium]